VPDGGYDEEEDCLNAEDESYRQVLYFLNFGCVSCDRILETIVPRTTRTMRTPSIIVLTPCRGLPMNLQALEAMEKDGIKKHRYSGGELQEDGSDDDEMDDLAFTSPIENMNVIQHFLDTMGAMQARDGGSALTASLQAGLGEEDKARLQGLIALAHERAAAAATGATA
jgi:hypothetical protein